MIFSACGAPESPAEPNLLARVGDRIVTTQDFIRRAEYTLRPEYCSSDNYIHRKIILNSLIAEKLLALEAEGRSPLDTNRVFQNYLQGRQEQAMRQWLYKEIAFDQVVIDSAEQRRAYKLAGRSYELDFFQLPDSSFIPGFRKARAEGLGFDEIFQGLSGLDSLPRRTFNWLDRESEEIHAALFAIEPRKGEVLEPILMEGGEVLVLRVAGWTDCPAIGEQQVLQRWNEVGERLHEMHARRLFKMQVAELMRGRKLQFNPAVFLPYSRAAAERYLKTPEEKRKVLNAAIWELEEHLEFGPEMPELRLDPDDVLMTVDEEEWTVRRFQEHLQRHPLVFRKRTIGRSEFPEQFKYAIADMIRDDVVTQEAYDRGYAGVPAVVQHTALFRDYYLSRQYRDDYLRQVVNPAEHENLSEVAILELTLNPLVDSLQSAYSDRIWIDTDLFETITVTPIPMMASQRGVPFPLMVPAFPRLTTDDRLDYGRRMEKQP